MKVNLLLLDECFLGMDTFASLDILRSLKAKAKQTNRSVRAVLDSCICHHNRTYLFVWGRLSFSFRTGMTDSQVFVSTVANWSSLDFKFDRIVFIHREFKRGSYTTNLVLQHSQCLRWLDEKESEEE